jgi:hypothetical protein
MTEKAAGIQFSEQGMRENSSVYPEPGSTG